LAKQEAAVTTHTPVATAGWQQCAQRGSAAIDQSPPAPAELRLGRFSTGIEQRPDAPDKLRLGRFSTGIEQRPDAPGKLRRGSFADGYAASK
jgi:hypothetical protein